MLEKFPMCRKIKKLSSPNKQGQQGKTEENVVTSPLNDIVLPKSRFLDRLWRDYFNFENHIAIECVETKKSYTYKQVRKNMAVFATSLRKKLELSPGDVVAVMLPNCPQFPVVAFGTLQAGCVLTTVSPVYVANEVTHQVTLTEPKAFITIPQCYEIVLKGLNDAKSDAKIIIVDNPQEPIPEGTIRYSEISEVGPVDFKLLNKVKTKNSDVAVIPFSSGTTGTPKGIEITYSNLLAAIEITQDKKLAYQRLTKGDFQDVVPCIMPFVHIYGLVITLCAHLAAGCKLLSFPKFSAPLFFEVLKTEKPTLLYIIPRIATLLAHHPLVTSDHLGTVRSIICGAAPLHKSDVEALLNKSKNKLRFHHGYGTTETTALITATLPNENVHDFDACGIPLSSVRIKCINPQTGQAVPIGMRGEVCVLSPTIMKGYHKNAQATAECFTEDGYYRTGDLGYYKQGVGLFIIARISDIIKVEGKEVMPKELESLLCTHPAVDDAAVVGAPHSQMGEVPKAFVVVRAGVEVSAEEIRQFIDERVVAHKRIGEIVFVKDIPKTNSGKILRVQLKAMASNTK